MNKKYRSVRAGVAVVAVAFAVAIKADEFAHIRAGAEYHHDVANVAVAIAIGVAVVSFAWNAIQYAKHAS